MASVKVAVRVRPLSKRELDMQCSFIINMERNKTFITNVKLPTGVTAGESHTLGRERVKQFTYDYSYCSVNKNDPNYASQGRVYQDLGDDVVDSAYQGYNACVFAYGQTGSGKTYTMMGNPDPKVPFDEEDIGIIPRICQNLFGKMVDETTTYRTEVSYMEIYNERVRDLLREKEPREPPNLRVREHPKEGPYVQDLSKHLVVNYGDIEELMQRGNQNRTTAATNMNDHSSRSHAIFSIVFTQARFTEDIPCEINSKINLVDLAGSERVDASGATGQRLKEGGSINRSLVTLGNVISTLADLSDKMSACRKNVFIPYRDSILTWLLKDSLGGNSRTIMIATISPADCNYAETLSTLRYASRAKRIINKPTINEDPNVALIRELREENAQLRALLGRNIDFDATQEKLNKNEEKVKQLTEKWTGKWKEAATILHEHKQLALRREGSGVVLDSDLPYLLALEDHVLSTGMKLYHLKEGETTVGREDAATEQDIIVVGQYVEAEHCIFTHWTGEVMIVPLEGALCSVNNVRIHGTTKLSHGSMIRLGRNHVFRFNHPGEVAKLKEELKMKGDDTQLLKVCPDFQWTWSTLSVVDSAVGSSSDLDLDLRSCTDELEKLEEKRRMIERLEEEHCLAEAARLAQLAEQEGNKVELEEREEELLILKNEATHMKREAEEAHKEIKRLSANIEQQVEEHISYKEKLAEEQRRLAQEKDHLEKDLVKAREERQRLRKQREAEQARIQLEKERQQEEWAQLNQEKRQLEIKKQAELDKLKDEKTKIGHVREVEKEVYSQAMSEMRNFIQAEVQEMKRLSGLRDDFSTGTNSLSAHSELDQLIDLDQLSLLDDEEEELERASVVESIISDGRGSIISLGSVRSDDSRVRRIIETVTKGHVPGEVADDSDIQSEMSTSISMKSPTEEEIPDLPDDDAGSKTPVPGSFIDAEPALPAKYLQGSPNSELPPEGLGVAGLSDSLYSSDHSHSGPVDLSKGALMSIEEITAMLNHLSLQVYDIHAKVCEVLTRKYTSILSSDDSTAGLGMEVITRFAHIRPLFDELEKIALHASKQTDRKNLPERLQHYDRTLTTIDQFLRIHEALQAINQGIKAKKFLEAIENMERVHLLFSEVDVDGEAEKAVHKVLQTEICIQREQLLFQLGETFNNLLKWTLPNDSRRNANQPRTTTLEVSEEDENKSALALCTQAMSDVNLLQTRLKTFCDRLMTYFVEAIVQDRNALMQVVAETNRSILCIVQYPKSQAQRQLTPVPVPPAEVFTKLEQIFIFLHGPLGDIHVQESPKGASNPKKVLLLQKFGDTICKRLFEYLFTQCLQHAIPKNNKNWDRFNEVVAITERFQETLCNLNFTQEDKSSLMDYFNNVNSMFANMKSQEIIKQAHELMTQDLHDSVTISADFPLGRDAGRRAQGGPMPEGLVEFVQQCREESGTSQQKIPTCEISIPVRSLVCLAYDTLREAVSSSSDGAGHLSHSVQNIFELYCDIVPSYHKEKLTKLPLLAALHHNNCMFVAHHLLTLDKQFRKKLVEGLTGSSLQARLGELVPQIRRLGNENFTQHIVVKKQQICDHLTFAEGFDCVADDEGDAAATAVKQMLHHLRHISTIWRDILPAKVYCKAVGTLLNAAVTEIVDSVANIGEFSADDCETLQKVLLNISDVATDFFKLDECKVSPEAKVSPEVMLHECVPNWMKFRELLLVLNSGLQDVADRWADGKGPLALHFTAEEIRRLVIAMFENTSKRDFVLAQLR